MLDAEHFFVMIICGAGRFFHMLFFIVFIERHLQAKQNDHRLDEQVPFPSTNNSDKVYFMVQSSSVVKFDLVIVLVDY